jgi:hypothetical protein
MYVSPFFKRVLSVILLIYDLSLRYYYASVDKAREKVKEMIKQDEWNTSQFPELKQDLLEKLNVEYNPITNETVIKELAEMKNANEKKLIEVQNANEKLTKMQNDNEQRLIEMQSANEQKLTEIQNALIAMQKLIAIQNTSS